jgi:hypothetical protein
MFGFSVYLNSSLDDSTLVYIKAMRRAGFTGVFTSLHIPEDDAGKLVDQLSILRQYCAEANLELVADVSQDGFAKMGIDYTNSAAIRALGLSGLRLDFGFTNAEIAGLSRILPIALNASTISETDLRELREAGGDMNRIEAWHNYYPRPETGLDAGWYARKNEWLHDHGIKTMGFVPGDGKLRMPIQAGLPTLEEHRGANPLASALQLQQLATDRVYIGDETIKDHTRKQFAAYIQEGKLLLDTVAELPVPLYERTWHNRPDVARDVVRFAESRELQLLATRPAATGQRVAGSVTVDNDEYGRYAGEVQIARRDLPADKRVNLLGQLTSASCELLPFVDAGQAVEFCKQ